MLTARQYGEVVLPDAAPGQNPDTPRQRGQKVVTVQGGYGAVFAIQVQFLLSIMRVAVQVLSEPGIYHRLLILLACTGAVSPLDLPLINFKVKIR